MEFNANDVAKKIMDAIQKEYKELKTLNFGENRGWKKYFNK